MTTIINIADYDPAWPAQFESEKERLQETLETRCIDIQHIGSTSVPGLAAKPIIDILVGVESLDGADGACTAAICGLGYEYVAALEKKLPGRRYFRRDTPQGIRSHHIHLVEVTSQWWRDPLVFRDYLRTHTEARSAYERLKRQLSQHEWQRGLDYAAAKTAFIDAVLAKAILKG